MDGFVDETVIEVRSGDGGRGAISFRREKYVPYGGPDGGNGGRGGDVVFLVKSNLKTLAGLRYKRKFVAKNGSPGGGSQKSGKDGADVEIAVPPGTVIKDAKTGDVLRDMIAEGASWRFLSGGQGGKGNAHFKSSTRQTPRLAQPGSAGAERLLVVELKLIADVGLVGLPNAGKSTLLSRVTNANPRIGSYPFTTKVPNLGVLRFDDRDVVIADIPGIIEGAASGAGMGLQFLKHISRSLVVAYIIDLSEEGFVEAVHTLTRELGQYSQELATRSRILIGSKLDVTGTDERLETLKSCFPDDIVLGISAVTGQGLDDLGRSLLSLLR